MNLVSVFFFNLGITFFILLIISEFNPELINKVNRSINKSYKNQTSEQLTGNNRKYRCINGDILFYKYCTIFDLTMIEFHKHEKE